MKNVLFLFIFCSPIIPVFSQEKPQVSPLNPEFLDYVNYSKSLEYKKSADEYQKGYVPSPMNIHFNQVTIDNENRKSSEALPVSYDLRALNMVTPVKNQGSVGACWSFSTMGAIESRWLKLGYGVTDLSEQNMATCHGFEAGIDDGGSDFLAAAYMSRLSGPVTEASDPYSFGATTSCKSTGLVIPAFSPQTIWLPRDRNIIKKAIMDYGAVTASIHMGIYSNYYSSKNATYLYAGTSPVDHGVLVVGWDDSRFVSGNFYKPANAGAWIVKNSWGTSFGAAGYFYVSYEDTKILSSCSYYPERVEKSEIDTMIMYDWLGATQSYGFRAETASGVARFNLSDTMFISKIGTFVNASGSIIDIDVFTEFEGDTLLKGKIASSYGNFCKFPGFYTFDIPALANGVFYVKVKYHTPGYNYPIPVEAKIVYQGEDYALPVLEPAGRFWISSEEKKWMPLGNNIKDYEADLSIRLYADRKTNLNPFFTSNKEITCKNGSFTFTSASNGSITSYVWNFGSGASPATASTAGPHTVSYSTAGLKNISLTVAGPSGTRTLVKDSYVEVVEALDIFLPYSEKLLVKGKSIPLVAYGADTYTWSPATGLNTTSGASVIASPTDTITYTVSGTMGACTGSSTIKLNVVRGPSYDDVCNAVELKRGRFPYNNIYATVEDGEPAPKEGDCKTNMEWCVEGGLQNSVWFWFTGPAGGKVSMQALGFDTQLAVYEAENCDSILFDKSHLVAAFDDYFEEDKFFAAALNLVDVVPGKKYYVQVDGSAGGEEGNFEMVFWEWPVSVDESLSSQDFNKLSVYPNPNNGKFRFIYNSDKEENIRIRVLNSKGQEVYRNDLRNVSKPFDQEISLSKISAGMYVFELTGGGEVLRRKVIVE